MDDFSFDTETFSTRPNAAILSVGIVQFDRETGTLGKELYLRIAMDDAVKHGHVSGSTLAWWMTQKDPGALTLFDPKAEPACVPAHGAVVRIRDFIKDNSSNPRVWGNGATADITWVESLFISAGAGLEVPWKFWNIRDMRTTLDDSGLEKDQLPAFEGSTHHALHDARHQARVISLCRQRIRGGAPSATPAARKPAAKKAQSPGVAKERAYWHNVIADLYFITEIGETLPVAGTCTQLTAEQYADATNGKSYWYDKALDDYFVVPIADLADDHRTTTAIRITKAEYDEATEL